MDDHQVKPPIKCYLLEHGYTSQTLAPCCKMEFSRYTTSHSEMLQHPTYIRVREQMAAGEWAPECHLCQITEEQGDGNQKSLRQTHGHREIGTDNKLKDLVINTQRLCNLQCRSCNPTLSSSWIPEYRKLPKELDTVKFHVDFSKIQVYPQYEYEYSKDDLSNLESVTLLGGEPLYDPKSFALLEKILHATNGRCRVSLSTNGTIFFDLDKYPWIREFEEIWLAFSIDAIGPAAEFIRTGCTWETVQRNIDRYRELSGLRLSYHCTHSVLNLFELNDVLEWMGKRNIPDSTHFVRVEDPPYLSFNILTDREKQYIADKLKSTPAKYIIDSMMDSTYDPDLRRKFLAFMEHTQQYYDMDWKVYLPELADMILQRRP